MSQTKAQLIDGKAAEIQFNTGSASTPTIAFTGDTNTGIYSPGADQVAISTGGFGRVFITSGGSVGVNTSSVVNVGTNITPFEIKGSATDRSGALVLSTSDNSQQAWQYFAANVYFTGTSTNHPVVFLQNNTERMRLDSSGRLGLGTSSPGELLDLAGGAIRLNSTHGIYKANSDGFAYLSGGTSVSDGGVVIPFGQSHSTNANEIHFRNSSNTTRMVIDASGRVGIGTTSPSASLSCYHATNNTIATFQSGDSIARATFIDPSGQAHVGAEGDNLVLAVTSSATEAARIDSSGRLLVGTSTSREIEPFAGTTNGTTVSHFFEGAPNPGGLACVSNSSTIAENASFILLARTRGSSVGQNTVVQSGDNLGTIGFAGADGTDIRTKAAAIYAEVDGTPGANDMPGRLVFSTTADGASSPTERLRITSAGLVGIGTTTPSTQLEVVGGINATDNTVTMRTVPAGTVGYFGTTTNHPLGFRIQDSEKARIDTSGRLLVGTSSSVSTYRLEVVNDNSTNVALLAGNNSAASGPFLTLRRSRGSTASPTVVSSGDAAGVIDFRGYSGAASAYLQCATIAAEIDGTPDSAGDTTDMPGRLVFSTTADGAGSPTERMRIDSSGRLLIGTTVGTAKLTVQDARVEVRNINGASIGNGSTTSVSTTATTIINDAGFQGRLWVINGADASNRFCDLVMASTSVAPVVVQSFSALGTPAARTYTRSGSAVQLAMASGTYDVRCIGLGA